MTFPLASSHDHDAAALDTPRDRPTKQSPVWSLCVFVIATGLPILAGYFGVSQNQGSIEQWFAEADRAPWAIKPEYYPALWIALAALAGLSYWCVWRKRDKVTIGAATVIYLAHCVLTTVWLSVFFNQYFSSGNKALWIALILALVHFALTVATIAAFDRASKLASWFFIPYLFGVGYLVSVNVYSALNNY